MSIFLYVVRHGEAESIQVNDETRVLTEIGKIEAKKTGNWLKSQTNIFDLVICSPYLRAQETKNIILTACETSDEVTSSSFIPSSIPATATDEIFAYAQKINKQDQHILCVSHMPLVSYLIGELSGHTPIMATAAVAKLKLDINKWNGQLETIISPEQMEE
ncbi:phosphohistidine phosphatase SixA [Psychrosphaera aestuarii]|uniref:phosphohistidine phosphatase SixA n=1 Tax=Psychrosphaera aestuarii TaxID=1266052 RepID=UPI001B33D5D5|nr:phosphohistidine phosphatase SixA [Psychrosphaera aestuarii]